MISWKQEDQAISHRTPHTESIITLTVRCTVLKKQAVITLHLPLCPASPAGSAALLWNIETVPSTAWAFPSVFPHSILCDNVWQGTMTLSQKNYLKSREQGTKCTRYLFAKPKYKGTSYQAPLAPSWQINMHVQSNKVPRTMTEGTKCNWRVYSEQDTK